MATECLLSTERLLVRGFTLEDLDAFHAYRNDPAVARWQGWSVPYSLDDARALVAEMAYADLFRRGAWTQLAVERLEAFGLIGDIGVRMEADEPTAELGVTLAPSAQGLGLATEALEVVIDHLFREFELARVIAIAHQDHERVHRLLDRLGLDPVARDGADIVFSRRRMVA